ncbi:MAG: cysteine synthase family protein [Candidatus Micrarchaeia archaeon]|jgi:cysteine synthase A
MTENHALDCVNDAIGNTPLVRVGEVYAKLETYNPIGSVKDRMAAFMISQAEDRGELKAGSKIIEVTTGNTGIAFAMLSAARGYKFTAVMPESMSIERRKMMLAFGAELVLTPAAADMPGAIAKYNELVKANPDAWLPKQFENPDNVEAHRRGIGKEIVEQTGGNVSAVVAGMGTGGTLMGIAMALKDAGLKTKVIGVEPAESAVLTGGPVGIHGIQGIGEGFVPKIIEQNRGMLDEVYAIGTQESIDASRMIAKKYGYLVGISSGANYLAALRAKEKYGGTVVTVFADRGERYLSSME